VDIAAPLGPTRQANRANEGRSAPWQLAALALCAVTPFLRLWEMGVASLWGDEAWTVCQREPVDWSKKPGIRNGRHGAPLTSAITDLSRP
jgi:hypothetical protein